MESRRNGKIHLQKKKWTSQLLKAQEGGGGKDQDTCSYLNHHPSRGIWQLLETSRSREQPLATANKKTGILVLQPHRTELCQQLDEQGSGLIEAVDHVLFFSCSQSLTQCKAHGKCLIHVCGVNRCEK
ncbi:uncharacterized protein AAG666_006460 isoform 7-T25 [Megaptera novaeangliae]